MPRRQRRIGTFNTPIAKPKRPVVDGYRFDSVKEAGRYGSLRALQNAGHIRRLVVHPKLKLIVNGRRIGSGWITLDFRYERQTVAAELEFALANPRADPCWITVWEDVKGFDTPVSKIRRTLCEALHGIHIEVIT